MEYELTHHGILGQKLGVRRYQNEDGTLTSAGQARYNHQEAQKKLKQTVKDAKRDMRSVGWLASRDGAKKIAKIQKRVEKADIEALDAKAAYNKSRRGDKAEFRTYVNAQKTLGLSGSIADQRTNGRGTRLYDHIAQTKGKEYAERVSRKAGNEVITSAAVGTAVSLGVLLVETIMATQ